MINDKAIEYNSKVIKIERLIENLKSIGINTEKYDNELQIIKEDLLEEHSKSTSNKYFGIENDYISAISRLNKLEAHLNEYMIYFKVNSFVNYITNKVDDLTGKELDSHIDKVINLLKELKQSNTLIYDKEKEIVEKLYKITYLLLLSEVKNGSKKLLNYVTKNEVDLYYLDKILLSEIESINNKNDLRKIKDKISLINSDGVEVHYVTKEILTDIVYAKYGENLREKVSEELNKINNELKDNQKRINEKEEKRNDLKSLLEKKKSELKEIKKNIAKKVGGLAINLSILGAIFGIYPSVTGKIHDLKTYTEVYDLDGELIKVIDEGYCTKFKGDASGLLMLKNDKSNEKYYVFPSYSLDSVLDSYNKYKDHAFDFGRFISDKLMPSEEVIEASKNSEVLIAIKNQDETDYIYRKDNKNPEIRLNQTLSSVVVGIACFLGFEITIATFEIPFKGIIPKSKELYLLIKKSYINYLLEEIKEEKLDLALMNAELMKLIQNDNVLREEFMRIYKANESLFNENKEVFEELLNEIDGNGKTLTLN